MRMLSVRIAWVCVMLHAVGCGGGPQGAPLDASADATLDASAFPTADAGDARAADGGDAATPDGGDAGEPAPTATGFIRVATDAPTTFRYDGGARFFPMGDTAYFLMGQPMAVIDQLLDTRAAFGFNFIRMGAIAPGFWPFGGDPTTPDFSVIDETAMQKMDTVFAHAEARGIHIELILWLYGEEGGEGLWGNAARESFWVDAVVTRYRDSTTLFLWTVANEFERYPTGSYSYAESDVDWARSIASQIRSLDPVHPVGVHPSVWITDAPPYLSFDSYQGVSQHHPPVVWPLWEGSDVNVLNTQNNGGVQTRYWSGGLTYEDTDWEGVHYPATWTDQGWDMEAPGLEDSIAEDWLHGEPVIDSEFGYQYEAGVDSRGMRTHQLHTQDTTRRKAWKIVTAGGYFAAGFAYTAVEFDAAHVDTWRPEQLQILHDFFVTRTRYWRMAPHLEAVDSQNVLLAEPGEEYVAYFPRGGSNTVDVAPGAYQVEWLDPRTGTLVDDGTQTFPGGEASFTCPGSDDWTLHLRAAAP